MNSERIAILIPSFNESKNLPTVITEIISVANRLKHQTQIVVIDDGSTDDTYYKIREIKKELNLNKDQIKVLRHPFNCGVGAAMRTGFIFAAQNDFDYAIQIDADGQHAPESFPNILQKMITGLNLVIGSRFLNAIDSDKMDRHTSKKRTWVLKILSSAMSRILGQTITDSTSGFRGYDRAAILYFSKHYPSEYLGDTLNSIFMARANGFRFDEVSVSMSPRLSGKRSQGRIRSVLYLARALFNIVTYSKNRKLYE